MGAGSNQYNAFINDTFGSAIGFMNYTDANNQSIANSLLGNVYTNNQLEMIRTNQTWYNNAIINGMDADSMVSGNAGRTQAFDKFSGELTLATSNVSGAVFFEEWHSGIDFGSGGTSVNTPGGIWQYEFSQANHRIILSLYGSDMRMRIQHLDSSSLNSLEKNTLFGSGKDSVSITNYPTASNGSGTGVHTHFELTRRLVSNGKHDRLFVNPDTLQVGSRVEYPYGYKDANKNYIQGNYGDFNRGW